MNSNQLNDNMDVDYINNPDHYKTGLTRIGCTLEQAIAYSSLFDVNRIQYYEIVDDLINRMPAGSHICDVGMGTGVDLLYFAEKHKDKIFFGVELSKETIEIAKNFFSKSNLNNVLTINDPEWFKKNKFDLIINNCVYEHVGDVDKFTKSISTALNHDGNFVFVVPSHAYSIFWNLLFFAIRFIFKGKPDTHSVEHKIMLKSISDYGLHLAGRRTIGFRPPQTYFVSASVANIERLRDRNKNLSKILKKLKLESCLYLNVYYGSTSASKEMHSYENIKNIFKTTDDVKVTLKDFIFLFTTYFKWMFYIHPKTMIIAILKRK